MPTTIKWWLSLGSRRGFKKVELRISLNPLPLRFFLVLFFRRFTIWVPPVLGLVAPKPNCYKSPRWFFNYYFLCLQNRGIKFYMPSEICE